MSSDDPTPYRAPAVLRYQPAVLAGATGLLEETIISAPSSTELYRTPTNDYVTRFMASTPHIAELFHRNSEICACSDANTVLDREALEVAKTWFYETALKPDEEVYDRAAAAEAGLLSSVEEFAQRAGRGLMWLVSGAAREVCYALDVFIIDGMQTWRVLPGYPEAWLERTLTQEEAASISELVPEIEPRIDEPASLLLVVAGSPWRYMMLQGPRGYRRTLLDAGRCVALLEEEARMTGTPVRHAFDFVDAGLHRLLRLDGVERNVLAVLAYGDEVPEEEEDA